MRVFFCFLFLFSIKLLDAQVVYNKVVFGDQSRQETATAIKELPNSDVIILGYSGGSGPKLDQYSLSLLKKDGSVVWTKLYGDSLNDYGLNMRLTDENKLIVCGEIKDEFGKVDAFIAKHDFDGVVIWKKIIGVDSLNESLKFIEPLPDGGFIATGYITETSDNDPQNDILVIRFDSTGAVVWQKAYGFQDNDYSDAIRLTPDGGFVLTADVKQFENGRKDYDIYILKMDGQGVKEWDLLVGDEKEHGCQMIIVNSNGDYTVVGEQTGRSGFGFDGTVIRVSNVGELLYHKTIDGPGTDAIFSVIEVHPDTLVMAGYSNSINLSLPLDGFMVITDADANVLGKSYIGSPGIDIVYEIITNQAGGFSMAGVTTTDGISKYLFASGSREPTMGINDKLFQEDVLVSPQPSSGQIQLTSGKNAMLFYTLMTLDGRVLQHGQLNNAYSTRISLPQPSGIYILSVVTTNGRVVKKIVLE